MMFCNAEQPFAVIASSLPKLNIWIDGDKSNPARKEMINGTPVY